MALFAKRPPVVARKESVIGARADSRFLVILTFAERAAVKPNLNAIREAAAYIPKYWSVTDDDRAFMRDLFFKGEARCVGGSVCFEWSSACQADDEMRRIELLQERANGWEGSRFYVGDGVMLSCELAIGGLHEAVTHEVEELLKAPSAGGASSQTCKKGMEP